jgi:hypothetical protein
MNCDLSTSLSKLMRMLATRGPVRPLKTALVAADKLLSLWLVGRDLNIIHLVVPFHRRHDQLYRQWLATRRLQTVCV